MFNKKKNITLLSRVLFGTKVQNKAFLYRSMAFPQLSLRVPLAISQRPSDDRLWLHHDRLFSKLCKRLFALLCLPFSLSATFKHSVKPKGNNRFARRIEFFMALQ